MVKPLLVVAVLANLYLVSSTGTAIATTHSSSDSSGSSSSASATAAASRGSGPPPPSCDKPPPPSKDCGPPKCKLTEVWSNCPAAVCRPKTCNDVGFEIACPDLKPNCECPVPPGCICIEGYVRNAVGMCVPMKHCPSCRGDVNAVSGCGTNCNRRCSNYFKKPEECKMPCIYNGCECRLGYVFDEIIWKCVLPSQCTICRGVNEVFDPCPPPCPAQSCDVNPALVLCEVPPQPGDPRCKPGCRCINDYVRNYAGVCIPRDKCPTCPPNEVYDPCIAPCPPRKCDVDESTIRCAAPPKLGDSSCVAGCRCADGYYRNKYGACVTKAECHNCNGPNEYYACGGACDNVCSTMHAQNQTHCPIINIRCNDMCYCDEGHARDEYGICIPIHECKVPKCPKHEVYNYCIQENCHPKTCKEVGFPVKCSKTDPDCCEKGCICEEGYVRDCNGVCIPANQCPSCGGDDKARAGCGVNCNKLCSDIGKEPGGCILICLDNACDCIDGYFYDEITKKCCLPQHCTPICRENEVYSDCIQGDCRPQNCSQLGFPIACPKIDPKYCKRGCLCKEGHARNDEGVCIPVKQCPSCGGDCNAESGCGKNCGRLCSNYNKGPVACTLECNFNACDCRKNYVFDTNTNQCVLPKDCTPVCKANEVYSDCINGGCSRKNCSQIGVPVPCVKIDPKYCIKGCLCKEGYLRECNGVCVPEKDCKPKCTKPNEVFVPCDYDCPPNTCKSLDKVYACPIREEDKCEPRCKCKDGFYRNLNNECISEADCRKCPGKHEYFSCGPACDNVCKTIDKQSKDNCPIKNIKCNEMCYCEKNYARALNGTCIPINRCKEPQCKKNERLIKCPPWLCQPKTCHDVGKPVPCPFVPAGSKCPVKPACLCIEGYVSNDHGECIPKEHCPVICDDDKYYDDCKNPNCNPKKCSQVGFPINCTEPIPCKKGCKCKDDLVKNGKGVCIPIKKCPSCGGDPNAVSGCGVNCGKKCEDLVNGTGICPQICFINKCDCKDGFYFDKHQNKCVIPSECTGICKKNAIYDDCQNPTCSPRKCSEVGFDLNCTNPVSCTKGCRCKDGYVEDEKGNCIPIKKCPSCGGDPNSTSGCGINCDKRCENLIEGPGACIALCKENGCDCNDGFFFDKNQNKCVLASECTGICDENEVFEDCSNPSCRPTKCCEVGYELNCTDPIKCHKGCRCKDDYVKDKNNVCIPMKECPSCKGDKNAQSGCGVNCLKKCHDLRDPKNPRPCPKICKVNSCDCKEGLFFDEDKGICVPPKDCFPKCPKHERFEMCPAALCQPKKCEQLGCPLDCPVIKEGECPGPPGCVCEEGYVRNCKGKCIPKKDCPMCGGDPNAVSGCGINCNKHCKDIGCDPVFCTLECKENSCDCRDDFHFDDNIGKCVPADCCSPTCNDNEVYDSCANGGCGHRNCSQFDGPIICIDPLECKGGCTCKKGYLRVDKTGDCVPERDCPNICNKANEEYVKCFPNCPPQTCESVQPGVKYNCPRILTKINPDDCIAKCRCKEGYYRNLKGECICKNDCLKCPNKHEYYSCGPACDNVCCDLHKQSKDNCPIKNKHKKCVSMCYCEDNYARDPNNNCIPIDQCPGRINITYALEKLNEGNIALNFEFLKELVEKRPGQTFMFSTLSLLNVLAFLAAFVKNGSQSAKELFKLENLNKEEIDAAYPVFLSNLRSQQEVIFKTDNAAFGNTINPFSVNFIETVQKVFGAEVSNINFEENVEAAATINKWASDKTEGLIDDIVTPDMLSKDTRMAFFNAMYFLGKWLHPFNVDRTEDKDFYLNDDDKISVAMMQQQNRFLYGESDELNCQILRVPYKGNFSLLIYLPKEKTKLADLTVELAKLGAFENSLSKLSSETVDFSLPKMKINTDLKELKEMVKERVPSIFSPSYDFDGIFENSEPLLVTDVIQKAVMTVDEKGTEAAVVTGGIVGVTSVLIPDKIYQFYVDHASVLVLCLDDLPVLTAVYAGNK